MKWEYRSIVLSERIEPVEALNNAGNDGWELVAVTSENDYVCSVAYLKRPKQEDCDRNTDTEWVYGHRVS